MVKKSSRSRNTSTADGLKKAVAGYLLKRGFSSHYEVGLCERGRLRADVLSVNYGPDIVVVEIKSGMRDFKTDKKYHQYLEFCNRMFFAFDQDTYKALSSEDLSKLKSYGIGLLVLQDSGFIKLKHRAEHRELSKKICRKILVRLAWRTGINRANSRRTKVFLD